MPNPNDLFHSRATRNLNSLCENIFKTIFPFYNCKHSFLKCYLSVSYICQKYSKECQLERVFLKKNWNSKSQNFRTAKRIKFWVKSKMGEIYRRYTRPNLKLELSFSWNYNLVLFFCKTERCFLTYLLVKRLKKSSIYKRTVNNTITVDGTGTNNNNSLLSWHIQAKNITKWKVI